jgi:hypothetical protein
MRLPYPTSLSVRTRLFLGMGIMLLPLVVPGVIALCSLQGVTDAIDDVVQEATEEQAWPAPSSLPWARWKRALSVSALEICPIAWS